jgi:Flp pilus assembly pilin Flp
MFESLKQLFRRIRDDVDGAVFVEYVLLVTLVGLGAIVGLSTVRDALINELTDLANAITNLNI